MSIASKMTLCIDTSGAATMALLESRASDADAGSLGYRVVARAREDNVRRHAESLGAMLLEVSGDAPHQAGIERICVGTGPGPFTGLRAGLAFASALGKALGVPVLGVPSQHALARAALDRTASDGDVRVLVTSDAKRGEVYWGVYEGDGEDVRALAGPNVGPLLEAEAAAAELGAIHVPVEVDAAFLARLADSRATGPANNTDGVGARDVGAEGEDETTFSLSPLYLRRPDVHVKTPAPK